MTHELLICDNEISYAKKLASYLNSSQSFPFVAKYCDDEDYDSFAVNDRISVILMDENSFHYESMHNGNTVVIPLCDSGMKSDGSSTIAGKRRIYKYQNCENIIHEVLGAVAECEGLGRLINRRNSMKILGFYSPVHRSGQTTLALALGQVMSKQCKVLYVNLERYSGLDQNFSLSFAYDLTDMIYEMTNGRKDLTALIAGCVRHLDGLDIFPVVVNSNDYEAISYKEWNELILRIEEHTDYDFLLLDISDAVGEVSSLLKLSDRVYCTTLSDDLSSAKLSQYKESLESPGTVEYVRMPEELSGQSIRQAVMSSQVRKLSRELAGGLYG